MLDEIVNKYCRNDIEETNALFNRIYGTFKNGIGYSPLTDKVYLGKQNTEKRLWVGDKKDILDFKPNVLILTITAGNIWEIKNLTQD